MTQEDEKRPPETEEEAIERGIRAMLDWRPEGVIPHERAVIPAAQQIDAEGRQQLRILYPQLQGKEEELFVATCNRLMLDPFARQIFPVWRNTKVGDDWKAVMAIQVSIDGFRIQAERSRKYQGQVGPLWCGQDGIWKDVWLSDKPPAAAKVGVWRVNAREPIWGTATWREYVQKTGRGEVTRMWAAMPSVMLAKCAEAIALRRALPYELSGVYSEEEMAQADNPVVDAQPADWRMAPHFQGAPAETVSDEIKTGSSDVLSTEEPNEEPPSREEQQERWAGAEKLVALGKGEKVSRDSDPDMKRFLEIQEVATGIEMKVSIPVLPFKRTTLVQMSESLLKTVNKKLEQLGKDPFYPKDPEAPPTVIDAEPDPLPPVDDAEAGLEDPLATPEQLGVIKRLADEKGLAEVQLGEQMYSIAEVLEAGCTKDVATMMMATLRELPAVPEEPDA